MLNIVTLLPQESEHLNLRRKSRWISHKSFAGWNATSCPCTASQNIKIKYPRNKYKFQYIKPRENDVLTVTLFVMVRQKIRFKLLLAQNSKNENKQPSTKEYNKPAIEFFCNFNSKWQARYISFTDLQPSQSMVRDVIR